MKKIVYMSYCLYAVCVCAKTDDNGIFPYKKERDFVVLKQCFTESFRDIVSQDFHMEKYRDQMADAKEHEDRSGTYIYRYQGKTVGYIDYGETQKNPFLNVFPIRLIANKLPDHTRMGMIYELAVLSEYRKQGFGEELCNFVIQDLKQRPHIKSIRVITTSDDVGRKFYQNKLGFKDGWFCDPKPPNPCFYWRLDVEPRLRDHGKAYLRQLIRSLVRR